MLFDPSSRNLLDRLLWPLLDRNGDPRSAARPEQPKLLLRDALGMAEFDLDRTPALSDSLVDDLSVRVRRPTERERDLVLVRREDGGGASSPAAPAEDPLGLVQVDE